MESNWKIIFGKVVLFFFNVNSKKTHLLFLYQGSIKEMDIQNLSKLPALVDRFQTLRQNVYIFFKMCIK